MFGADPIPSVANPADKGSPRGPPRARWTIVTDVKRAGHRAREQRCQRSPAQVGNGTAGHRPPPAGRYGPQDVLPDQGRGRSSRGTGGDVRAVIGVGSHSAGRDRRPRRGVGLRQKHDRPRDPAICANPQGWSHRVQQDRHYALGGRRELRRVRRRMQMIFQDPYSSLNPRMTAAGIVGEPLDIHGIGTKSERREQKGPKAVRGRWAGSEFGSATRTSSPAVSASASGLRAP